MHISLMDGEKLFCVFSYMLLRNLLQQLNNMHIDDNLFERVGAVILLVFDIKKSIEFYIFLIIAYRLHS